ncbi:MAG: flagellar biosynthesis protein FlhB [Candidatus Margulisbacteria bacterium]|nr:flagellar biosynthesis protein FlhB [Candidatus Margulisiibacteriota bacterium]
MGDQGDKTEEPTPHKLREARKKGQVVKSKEITTAFLFFASYYALNAFLPQMWQNMTDFFLLCFTSVREEITIVSAAKILEKGYHALMFSLLPIMLIIFFVAILLEFLQSGFNFSVDPLMPKLNKINPIEGFKKIFSVKGLFELAKSIAKMGIIVFIMVKAITPILPQLLETANMPVLGSVGMAGKLAFDVAIRVGLFFLVVAALDYFWQRHQFMKQMRMSKQEIKDEYKKLEGDPLIKQRQRDMALSLSGGRQSKGAAGADAVVTNPTHIAVAIKYDAEIMKAPEVVAKGKMLIAEEIKKVADENYIYILEDKLLAWDLFNTTEVGQEVPPDLYTEVAELLALVYEIKRKRKKRNQQENEVKDEKSK